MGLCYRKLVTGVAFEALQRPPSSSSHSQLSACRGSAISWPRALAARSALDMIDWLPLEE